MDPLREAEWISKIVSRGRDRKYYRFRGAPFYGGIATADCVGCCLRCIFCWSWKVVNNPGGSGKFHSPESVAAKLTHIARKKGYSQMRISGNEPTLNREHLLGVLEALPPSYDFILETNGILLGQSRSYAADLAIFPNLHVRVSLKGCIGDDFEKLTGMAPSGFDLQIKALENLAMEGVSCHPAVMADFSTPESLKALRRRLTAIDPGFGQIEVEEMILYPHVEKRLRRLNLIR